jgi:hypothetical protein
MFKILDKMMNIINQNLDTYKTFESRKDRLKKRVKKTYSDINNFKISSALKWGRKYKDKIVTLGKREVKETREAINIVIKMLSNKDVTNKEKQFVREQSKDIL